jgi:hypothetical protein
MSVPWEFVHHFSWRQETCLCVADSKPNQVRCFDCANVSRTRYISRKASKGPVRLPSAHNCLGYTVAAQRSYKLKLLGAAEDTNNTCRFTSNTSLQCLPNRTCQSIHRQSAKYQYHSHEERHSVLEESVPPTSGVCVMCVHEGFGTKPRTLAGG